MRTAFKEWAVVCHAMGQGRHVILLRKGGIHETAEAVRPRTTAFVLFPTRYHQTPEQVIAPFEAWKDSGDVGGETVAIRHVAKVRARGPVADQETLRRLRPFHIWSDAVVEERFHRANGSLLEAWLVRTFTLGQEVALPVLPTYGGCRSWIEIESEIDPSDSAPALDDDSFRHQERAFAEAVDGVEWMVGD